MGLINQTVTHAPEIFLLLAVALGTILGRLRIRGFAIGATACTLMVAILLGQLGTFVIPPLLKSLLLAYSSSRLAIVRDQNFLLR